MHEKIEHDIKKHTWLFILFVLNKFGPKKPGEIKDILKKEFDIDVSILTIYKNLFILKNKKYIAKNNEGKYCILSKGFDEYVKGVRVLQKYMKLLFPYKRKKEDEDEV